MPKMPHDKRGIKVVVSEDRYDMYGTPGSKREMYLAGLLKSQGGVSDTVAPGTYEFNVHREGLKLVLTLEPWED